MTKTYLASEPSRLHYPHSEPGPTLHDEKLGPQVDPDKLKRTPPKDKLDLPRSSQSPPSAPATRPLSEYLTRKQGAQFINDELGMPLSFSTAAKLASWGEFVEPALWWGRRPLYTRDDLRRWAEARSRKLEVA